jgi:hypothetical protein
MPSRTAKIYTDLLDIVKSIPNTINTDRTIQDPYFIYCNIWDIQIDESILGSNYAFNYPACFIEVDLGEGTQWMAGMSSYPDTIISFHIVGYLLDGGNDNMEQNIPIFTIKDLIKSKILGKNPSNCSSLQVCADKQDFKHKGVYKYILSFRTNFIDKCGSDYDPLGRDQQFGYITDGTMNLNSFKLWESNNDYTSGLNAISYRGLVYLCVISNSDIDFDVSKWELINIWTPSISYQVFDLVAFGSSIYECAIANSDDVFNVANWNKIYPSY